MTQVFAKLIFYMANIVYHIFIRLSIKMRHFVVNAFVLPNFAVENGFRILTDFARLSCNIFIVKYQRLFIQQLRSKFYLANFYQIGSKIDFFTNAPNVFF